MATSYPYIYKVKYFIVEKRALSSFFMRLKAGGYLHCATDWEEYAEHMLATLAAEPLLCNAAEGFAPRPSSRPLTRFENRGIRLGHGVWDLFFIRKTES